MRRITLLAGGVGGARMARGLAAVLDPADLTVVVNVGDDDRIHGVHVSADIDTVTYTLAGREGPHGWGLAGDTFAVMEALKRLGQDTTFRLGDNDLATCLVRTRALDRGESLSTVTRQICSAFGVLPTVLPASDDEVRTKLLNSDGEWLDFQDYFVIRRHRDEITDLLYEGVEDARPAPGVIQAIGEADAIVVAPSNPPLSVHPILRIPGIEDAVRASPRVVGVSPLFRGKALKGPADRLMATLGYPPGTEGVLRAYEGLLTDLIIDDGDASDAERLAGDVLIHVADTRIASPVAAGRFAKWLLDLLWH